MVALFNTASVAAIAFAVLPAVQAHMSIWTPSMYGFDSDWDVVTPLANQPFDQWVSTGWSCLVSCFALTMTSTLFPRAEANLLVLCCHNAPIILPIACIGIRARR